MDSKVVNDLSYHSSGERGKHWWLFGPHRGRYVQLGPYPSEEKAYEVGRHAYEGFFDVFPLDTRDRAKAAQELKAIMLERGILAQDGQALGKALQRMGHSIDGEKWEQGG